MNYLEAVNNMLVGKRMIRTGWTGFYLTILHGQNYISMVGKDSTTDTGVSKYTSPVEDVLAADWICKT